MFNKVWSVSSALPFGIICVGSLTSLLTHCSLLQTFPSHNAPSLPKSSMIQNCFGGNLFQLRPVLYCNKLGVVYSVLYTAVGKEQKQNASG